MEPSLRCGQRHVDPPHLKWPAFFFLLLTLLFALLPFL
jgi:hypothetical protein